MVNGEKVLHGADIAEAKLGSLCLSLDEERGSIMPNQEVDLAHRFKHKHELVTSYAELLADISIVLSACFKAYSFRPVPCITTPQLPCSSLRKNSASPTKHHLYHSEVTVRRQARIVMSRVL